ncbi:MAG: hypothetical protein ACRDHP_17755, partial [Ktedonobacterales bacterium]
VEVIAVCGVTVTVGLASGGTLAIPAAGVSGGTVALLDAVVLALQLQFLGLLPILLDFIFSLIGLLFYTIGQALSHHQELGGVHTNAAYGFPELTDEQRTLQRNLARYFKEKFGIDIPAEWLDYLIGMIAATGVSIDLIRGQILCLFQKGLLSSTYSKVWNAVTHSLEPDDLQGAWKDLNGIPVVKGGRSFIHFDKVEQGLTPLKAIANDPNAPPALRQACQNMIDYVNSVLDRSFPKKDSQWHDQARGPFWQDLLQVSGCSSAPAVPPGATRIN